MANRVIHDVMSRMSLKDFKNNRWDRLRSAKSVDQHNIIFVKGDNYEQIQEAGVRCMWSNYMVGGAQLAASFRTHFVIF